MSTSTQPSDCWQFFTSWAPRKKVSLTLVNNKTVLKLKLKCCLILPCKRSIIMYVWRYFVVTGGKLLFELTHNRTEFVTICFYCACFINMLILLILQIFTAWFWVRIRYFQIHSHRRSMSDRILICNWCFNNDPKPWVQTCVHKW